MRSPERDRMVVLDGLRGMAILLVVLSHAATISAACVHCPAVPPLLFTVSAFGGAEGVMLFFTLSGFLLFLPFARAILSPDTGREGEVRQWPSTWGFYVRRMRRILPAYYVALLVVMILPWVAVAVLTHASAARLPWGTFLGGATLVYDLNAVDFTRIIGADSPLWSLTVEWQFYLVLPLLALALRWFAGRGTGTGKGKSKGKGKEVSNGVCIASWLVSFCSWHLGSRLEELRPGCMTALV
jgi:peptidoglycan/LPS O-acetylase OafA/YrhL